MDSRSSLVGVLPQVNEKIEDKRGNRVATLEKSLAGDLAKIIAFFDGRLEVLVEDSLPGSISRG